MARSRFHKNAIALAVIGSLIAGCSKVSSGSTGSAANPSTIPGLLRIGTRNTVDSLNPLLGLQQIDVEASMFWAGYLFGIDDRNALVPDLATEVPTTANGGISADGKTITYHLRSGVRWQDGKPFTADDVLFTLRVVMDPDNPVPSRVGYELIDSIRKHGDETIVIHLRKPYAPFVSSFLSVAAAYPYCVLPEHLFGSTTNIAHSAYNAMPVGTGPFRVAKYEPGSEVDFVADPAYWRGRPKLDRVQLRMIGSDNTLLTLAKTHEIDMYYRIPHIFRRQLSGVQGERVVSAPFTRYIDLGFNTVAPIVSDVRVRQALAYATDRRAIIATVTYGGAIFSDSDQPPYLWAYDPDAPKYAYDPDRAKALLDAAGWRVGTGGIRMKDGVPLRLGLAGLAGDDESMTTREMLQAQWQRVGVATDIKSYPSDILYGPASVGGVEQTGHFDVVLEGFANGFDPDDSIVFECRWRPPQGQDVYRLCDPQLDAVEEAALGTNDLGARKRDYAAIQQTIGRELPIFVLYFEKYEFAVNADLQGFSPAHVNAAIWNPWALSI